MLVAAIAVLLTGGSPADPDRDSRNRELLNLIAVGLLTAIGFASVYIARSSLVDAGSLTYAGIFVALYLAAHLVARFTVPFADPVLLPLVGAARRRSASR